MLKKSMISVIASYFIFVVLMDFQVFLVIKSMKNTAYFLGNQYLNPKYGYYIVVLYMVISITNNKFIIFVTKVIMGRLIYH